jgi:hypothetical protein
LREEIAVICREAIHIVLSQDVLKKEEYNVWLSRSEALHDQYLLAQSYANELNRDQMHIVLDNIQQRKDVNMDEWANYYTYLYYLLTIRQEDMDESQIQALISRLENISQNSGILGDMAHGAIAMLIDRPCWERLTQVSICHSLIVWRSGYENGENNRSQPTEEQTNALVGEVEVNLYPNPVQESGDTKLTLYPNSVHGSGEIALILYPNPVEGILYIQLDNTDVVNIEEVKIYDMYGRLLRTESNIRLRKTEIDIVGLSAGVYFVNCKLSNGEAKTKRIVKE